MNKKKLLTLVASLGLIGAVGIGATLAYFTDTQTQTNVVSMGNVNITLDENSTGENAGTPRYENDVLVGYTYGGTNKIVPGDDISKIVTIAKDGTSEDARIRVKLTLSATDANGNVLTDGFVDGFDQASLKAALDANIDDTNWTEIGGYYYYTGGDQELNDGDTLTFMDSFKVPSSWNNFAADKSFAIEIQAEAIQADSLADGIVNADGSWTISADQILAY